jgi:hypothetical protein
MLLVKIGKEVEKLLSSDKLQIFLNLLLFLAMRPRPLFLRQAFPFNFFRMIENLFDLAAFSLEKEALSFPDPNPF